MIPTTSLEMSRKLKNAGFPQHTDYYWEIVAKNGVLSASNPFITHRPSCDNEHYAAPTTDELLAKLPRILWKELEHWDLIIKKGLFKESWESGYWKIFRNCTMFYHAPLKCIENKSLPEALAQMYLWLKSEGHIK